MQVNGSSALEASLHIDSDMRLHFVIPIMFVSIVGLHKIPFNSQ